MIDVCVSEVTKCSTSRSSSSTPTCVTMPLPSWRRRSRTTIVRSTDSRRARNSASEITWRLRDSARRSARRRRWASRRVEPLMATGSSTTATSGSSSSWAASVLRSCLAGWLRSSCLATPRSPLPESDPEPDLASDASPPSPLPEPSPEPSWAPRPRPRPRRRRRGRGSREPWSSEPRPPPVRSPSESASLS